jgi:hypothetical protein
MNLRELNQSESPVRSVRWSRLSHAAFRVNSSFLGNMAEDLHYPDNTIDHKDTSTKSSADKQTSHRNAEGSVVFGTHDIDSGEIKEVRDT